jgi:hypothetical protein
MPPCAEIGMLTMRRLSAPSRREIRSSASRAPSTSRRRKTRARSSAFNVSA